MAVTYNKKQNGGQAQDKSAQEHQKKIDLDALAQKIVALLLRELDIERERLGR
jgi:hypothetical protein